MSCFGVWSKALVIEQESFQPYQRTLSLFIRATICPLFSYICLLFLPCKIFSTGAAHTQVSQILKCTCVCAGVDLVCHSGQMLDVSGWMRRWWRVRVSWTGRRTCPGKADDREKRGFSSEEMRKKKGSQGGISEKRFLWNRRLCNAKKDIGWGSWGHCLAV